MKNITIRTTAIGFRARVKKCFSGKQVSFTGVGIPSNHKSSMGMVSGRGQQGMSVMVIETDIVVAYELFTS